MDRDCFFCFLLIFVVFFIVVLIGKYNAKFLKKRKHEEEKQLL